MVDHAKAFSDVPLLARAFKSGHTCLKRVCFPKWIKLGTLILVVYMDWRLSLLLVALYGCVGRSEDTSSSRIPPVDFRFPHRVGIRFLVIGCRELRFRRRLSVSFVHGLLSQSGLQGHAELGRRMSPQDSLLSSR